MCSRVFFTCGFVQEVNFFDNRSTIVSLVCSRKPSEITARLKSSKMSAETMSFWSTTVGTVLAGAPLPLPLLLIKTAKACFGGGFIVFAVLFAVAAASRVVAGSFVFFLGFSQYAEENGSMESFSSDSIKLVSLAPWS